MVSIVKKNQLEESENNCKIEISLQYETAQ